MAVDTHHLSERAIRQHLRPFQVGDLIAARGVAAGPQNALYDVSTTRGRFLVRILANRSPKDIEFEDALLLRLLDKGLCVPRMVGAGKRGRSITLSSRQHLSVFRCLPGRQVGVFEVTTEHARQVGEFLGAMHVAARGLRRRRKNRVVKERLAEILAKCAGALDNGTNLRDIKVLALELGRYDLPEDLPRGPGHGGLFIDKVRFQNGVLCGVADFEAAATAPLLYDLAVGLCDWAFLHDRFVPENARALVRGYQSKRKLGAAERGELFDVCRFAVTRFAVTRMYDFEVRKRGALQLYRDYRHFMSRLSSLRTLGPQGFRDHVFGRARDIRANA